MLGGSRRGYMAANDPRRHPLCNTAFDMANSFRRIPNQAGYAVPQARNVLSKFLVGLL